VADPETYTVPADVMNVIYNTLQYFGNETSYRGQRTGGVLQGCPRGPAPTPAEMSVHARLALKMIDLKVLGRESAGG
jgi:hypothetical protein